MTIRISTIPNGNIEGGFFSVYTRGFRLEEYAFPTQNVCNMLRYLAENPEVNAINLLSFGRDLFFGDMFSYMEVLAQRAIEKSESLLPELTEVEFGRMMEEEQGRFDTDQLSLIKSQLEGVPIRISDNENVISVGQYKINRTEFQGIAAYLLGGGWLGWSGETPKFAQRAYEAVKESDRQLYMGLFNN